MPILSLQYMQKFLIIREGTDINFFLFKSKGDKMTEKNIERTSIRTASRFLGVTEKTVTRYLKVGELSKIKEGRRTFIPMAELRELRKKREKQKEEVQKKTIKDEKLIVSRQNYHKLLEELGELKEKCRYLLEYSQKQEAIQKQLDEKQTQLSETNEWLGSVVKENKDIQDENTRLKKATIFQDELLKQRAEKNEELTRALEKFQRELDYLKKRGFFQRIFNK